MRAEEAGARAVVQSALEEAVYSGEMTVGARGWRAVQADVCAGVLDSDHPDIPGQSWRTAIVTERIEAWVSAVQRRSPILAAARARVGNRLLHPVGRPVGAAVAVRPLVWLLGRWGDEQPLTQAGYLKPAFVQSLQADRPWTDPLSLDRPVRNELDDVSLHQLRSWLQQAGAVRKHKSTLRRTTLGRAMVTDPELAWDTLVTRLAVGGDDWDAFVVQTALLFLVDHDAPVSNDAVVAFVVECAVEMGWQTRSEGLVEAPSSVDVSWAFADARRVWEPCGLISFSGDWRSRQVELTELGRAAGLHYLRHVAAGPMDSPW